KSMIDYNTGNPDGILDQGEEPRPPRIPLVAIYPKEGTLFSDNPFIILDAEWVDENQKQGARLFQDFVQKPENQERVLEFGFRPGNSEVAVGAPIVAANGVDPTQPATLLDVPSPEVAVEILDLWEEQRKTARVDLVIDVSGSMGEFAVPGGNETKLDLAKRAAIEALDQFGDDDEVGLRIFTTDLDADGAEFLDLVQVERVGDVREALKREISQLVPLNGTPLYSVTQASFDASLATFDPTRINAVVLLTDGVNEDGDSADDRQQLDDLLGSLRANSASETGDPVRVFAIGYGEGADFAVLSDIASASNGAVYDASDPASISKVFAEVISNF
ncbi:MAG TPA: VWA domain-containing protein, partial [Acidimicrobiales bacterium]|nr:VWA domain-containing protein [Acidimicrobiales bacterium]